MPNSRSFLAETYWNRCCENLHKIFYNFWASSSLTASFFNFLNTLDVFPCILRSDSNKKASGQFFGVLDIAGSSTGKRWKKGVNVTTQRQELSSELWFLLLKGSLQEMRLLIQKSTSEVAERLLLGTLSRLALRASNKIRCELRMTMSCGM